MKMTPKIIVVGGLAVVLFVISVVVFLPWAIFNPKPTLKTDPSAGYWNDSTSAVVESGQSRSPSEIGA